MILIVIFFGAVAVAFLGEFVYVPLRNRRRTRRPGYVGNRWKG